MKDPVPRSLSRSALLQYRRSNGDQELAILHSTAYPFVDRVRILHFLSDERQQSRTNKRTPDAGVASPRSPQSESWGVDEKHRKLANCSDLLKIIYDEVYSRVRIQRYQKTRDIMHEEREHQRNCAEFKKSETFFRSTSFMELRCTWFIDMVYRWENPQTHNKNATKTLLMMNTTAKTLSHK